jgi:uridine kinase
MSGPLNPFFVGIVGGTGSGKTTVADRLVAALPAASVAVIAHDNYYCPRPDLSPSERELLNFDHPDALDNALLLAHLDSLRAGNAVQVPVYDFATHLRRIETKRIEVARVVIVEGILLLADDRIRSRLDLKLYVDTDADIRILRRMRRDMEERGRTFEQVCEQYYKTVRPMHLQFVEPSKRYADVIIPEGGHNVVALDLVVGRLKEVQNS